MNHERISVTGAETRNIFRKTSFRLFGAAVILFCLFAWATAAEVTAIKLNPPSLKRGLPLMVALSVRASAREFSEKDLSLQDLSDLLWAADGMSRPSENKSTAPSAMNAHDVRIYIFMKDGAYLYDAPKHELSPVLTGDFRLQIMMARPPRPGAAPVTPAPAPVAPKPPVNTTPGQPTLDPKIPFPPPAPPAGVTPPPPPPPAPANPPVQIILVSDGDRFTRGGPEQKFEWGALDAGIISQNISLFCAATGLKTCPKASMNKARIKELLKLTDAQTIFLNHPVGYMK
jgi:nitroreductase